MERRENSAEQNRLMNCCDEADEELDEAKAALRRKEAEIIKLEGIFELY